MQNLTKELLFAYPNAKVLYNGFICTITNINLIDNTVDLESHIFKDVYIKSCILLLYKRTDVPSDILIQLYEEYFRTPNNLPISSKIKRAKELLEVFDENTHYGSTATSISDVCRKLSIDVGYLQDEYLLIKDYNFIQEINK